MRIFVLSDNTSSSGEFLNEHGFSCFVQDKGVSVLLDTGASDVFAINAQKLNIDLTQVQHLILSHGHWDHTGGLAAFFKINSQATIWLHPAAIQPHYSMRANGIAYNGMSAAHIELLQQHPNRVRYITQPTQIEQGLWVSGYIPRITEEGTGGAFFLDNQAEQVDEIQDDMCLLAKGEESSALLLGCCHAGLRNSIMHWQNNGEKMHLVCILGGMHLHSLSQEALQTQMSFLENYPVQNLFPCHCTGEKVIAQMLANPQLNAHAAGAGFSYSLSI